MAQKDEDLDLDVETDKPKKSGKLGKILLFGGIGVLIVAMAVTITVLLMRGGHDEEAAAPTVAEKSAPEAKVAKAKPGAGKTPLYLDVDPPFVVNLNDDSGVRFLQVAVSVMAYNQEALDKVQANMPLVRHNLMLLFSSQKFSDIKTRDGKVALQEKALATVRSALKEVTGQPLVDALYLPSIVGQ